VARKKGHRGRGRGRGVTRYHDRVAGRYDQVYRGPYWEVYERLSLEGIRRHLPRDLAIPLCDLGCGTGLYGLKLLKSGYRVTFCDISIGMLEQARRKAHELPGNAAERAEFVQDDVASLERLPADTFGLAIAQGDPICHAGRAAPAAFRACARVLRPGGVLVASVDNALAGFEHYLDRGDVEGLLRFERSGLTEWLTREKDERFEVRMFRPRELRRLVETAGLEMLDLFGKPVLPLRRYETLLEDAATRKKLLALEQRLCREEALWGRAAHLQLAARRPVL